MTPEAYLTGTADDGESGVRAFSENKLVIKMCVSTRSLVKWVTLTLTV